ncbi:hypothetical protein BJV77DRAFT_962842 [Russula vinacea]|nr:hypothetical protein BJV77DRAFT_962842 [Russula vinacea]
MITSVQSVAAKLGSEIPGKHTIRYFHEELVRRLDAVGPQGRTLFGHIQRISLGVLAKKLWARPTLSPITREVTVSESFDITHIFNTEKMTPFYPIRRRVRVQPQRDVHLGAHYETQNLYSVDLEGNGEQEYKPGPFAHLDPSDDHQYQYQDLYTILEETEQEWELRDLEFCAMLETENNNNHVLNKPETGNEGTSGTHGAGDDTNVSIWLRGDDGTALPRFLLPSDAGIDSGSTHAISEQERTKHTTAQYSSARPRVRIRGRSILRVQGNHGQTRIEDEVKWDELQDTLARCQT